MSCGNWTNNQTQFSWEFVAPGLIRAFFAFALWVPAPAATFDSFNGSSGGAKSQDQSPSKTRDSFGHRSRGDAGLFGRLDRSDDSTVRRGQCAIDKGAGDKG